ncbi:MAG: GNAT family N-acetyltransferase [Lachnospiraceae bacterium]|nr:GNAT family N-acetyltransferase [Lachnospiraceae bacterium]
MEISWAEIGDWVPAMCMIWESFMEFDSKDYTKKAADNFYDFITDPELYESFLDGGYRLCVCKNSEGKIVGAAGVRGFFKLSLLFVDGRYHKRGIGKRLVEYVCHRLKEEAGSSKLVVMAAPFAIGFYEKMGFIKTEDETTMGGMRITPMELNY